ncbi:MAG: hypothetical protein FWD34_06140 [Oscillospiraceae bacterium]|nr:hypothetical protein [Oscillospiraceae bacterium]
METTIAAGLSSCYLFAAAVLAETTAVAANADGAMIAAANLPNGKKHGGNIRCVFLLHFF